MSRRALVLCALALTGLARADLARGEQPVPLGPCGPVDRLYDPIELPIERLQGIRGTPIARVGVVAFRGGRFAPIPYQIDERNGRKLALPGGPEPTQDDRPGILDNSDLVVFMACDAGEQAPADALAAFVAETHPTGWREIRVEDPLDHTAASAYLVVGDDPPATSRRYVSYTEHGDLVGAAAYRVGLVDALPNYFSLVTSAGPGPNLLDGLRLRAEATLVANLARWTLNERQGIHRLIAWKAGPVRVVRRSRHQVNVGLGIHLTAATAHTYFYPRMVFGPGSLKLPISPGIVFRTITAFGGADFRDLRGWRYHAPGVPPEGFPIDGHMDDAEQRYDAGGDWFVVEHGDQAILMVTRMSENLERAIRLRLVYVDDPDRRDPPENAPGALPLVGYRGLGVERLAAGRYQFQLRIYVLTGYKRGDEKRILSQLDTSLTADGGASGP